MTVDMDLAPSFSPMMPADLEAVARAECTLYEFPWSSVNFADALRAGYSSWVMLRHGRLAGYALMMSVLDEVHLLNISVLQAHQGAGMGANLMRHMLSCATDAGARRMFLEVRPSNAIARRLYQRFGFVEIGRRPRYYPARTGREDAIVMKLEL